MRLERPPLSGSSRQGELGGGGFCLLVPLVKKHVVEKQMMTITLAVDGQRTMAGNVIRAIDAKQ